MAVELKKFRYAVFIGQDCEDCNHSWFEVISQELPRSDTQRVRSCEALARFFYCRACFKNQSLQAHCLQSDRQLSTLPVAAFLLYKNM